MAVVAARASWQLPVRGDKRQAEAADEEQKLKKAGGAKQRAALANENMSQPSSGKGTKKDKASRRQPDKKEKKGEDEDFGMNEVMVALAKLTLNNSQSLRSLAGCTLTTYLVPSDKAAVVSAQESSKTYDKAVREAGRGHLLGPPHLHVAGAFLEVVAADLEFKAQYPQARGVVDQFLTKAKLDEEVILECLSYFRVKKTFTKGDEESTDKVTFSVSPYGKFFATEAPFSPIQLHSALCHACVFYEGVRKLGPPPKPEVERVVERLLAKLMGK